MRRGERLLLWRGAEPQGGAVTLGLAMFAAMTVLSGGLRLDTSKQTLEGIAVRNVTDRYAGEIQLATERRIRVGAIPRRRNTVNVFG